MNTTDIEAIKYKWYYICQKNGFAPIFKRSNMELCLKTKETDGADYIVINFQFVNLQTSYAIEIINIDINSENSLFLDFYVDLIKQVGCE